ncbi:molybdopterin converting factor subunit 1 [Paenibacillus puldeungensis]|uniref:Molybdopterin synthase sulfur carrier subunit n=1 Tax=Paenibacillus puldeungensis TaxID=696536 RepID=A0ABW3RUW4_9BACL
MIKLLYFAGLRDVCGVAEEKVDLIGLTVGGILAWAADKYPNLPVDSLRVAVNEEYALTSDLLKDGDVVAFIPPVSGG